MSDVQPATLEPEAQITQLLASLHAASAVLSDAARVLRSGPEPWPVATAGLQIQAWTAWPPDEHPQTLGLDGRVYGEHAELGNVTWRVIVQRDGHGWDVQRWVWLNGGDPWDLQLQVSRNRQDRNGSKNLAKLPGRFCRNSAELADRLVGLVQELVYADAFGVGVLTAELP